MTRVSRAKSNSFKPTLLALVFAMLAGIIFMTISVATAGAEISKLEKESNSLQESKRELSEEVIKYSSVSLIGERSQKLGFAKPEKTVYLTLDVGVAAYVR